MIQASELTGAFDCADIRRFFDGANERGVTPLITANRAQLFLGQIEAPSAWPDSLSERDERRCQPLAELGRLPQEVVREPQRRLPANAGEA
jgi:hypothetical protein